jgi:hypothetical protein
VPRAWSEALNIKLKAECLKLKAIRVLGSGLTFDISRSGGIHKKIGPAIYLEFSSHHPSLSSIF